MNDISRNSEITWEPTKHLGLLSYYDGTKRWYHCCQCAYFNDRLYHSKMHFERIHVKKGRPIPRKQKYTDLKRVIGSDIVLDDFQNSQYFQNTRTVLDPEIDINQMPGFDDSMHASDSSDGVNGFAGSDSLHNVKVEVEETVQHDPVASDMKVDIPVKAESQSLCSSSATIDSSDFAPTFNSFNSIIFTFGDGIHSTSPNTTIGSYVSFDSRCISSIQQKSKGISEINTRSCLRTSTSDHALICEEIASADDFRNLLDQSELECGSKASLQDSPVKQKEIYTQEMSDVTLYSEQKIGTQSSLHSPKLSSKAKCVKEFAFLDKFSTPKSRRTLLDTTPVSTTLSCQQAGALVHEYLSGRGQFTSGSSWP